MKKIKSRKNFAELRLQRGLSQDRLADAAGISPLVVYRADHGGYFRPLTAQKICAVLGVDFDAAFEVEENDNV